MYFEGGARRISGCIWCGMYGGQEGGRKSSSLHESFLAGVSEQCGFH